MNIYREEILDHFKNPRNFGKVIKMDEEAEERNSSCGDRIKIGVKIKKLEVTQPESGQANLKYIAEVRFEGEGCAISMAATSMLTEMVKGKTLKELKNSRFKTSNILERMGIPISSARKKCATLGLVTWQNLVKKLDKK